MCSIIIGQFLAFGSGREIGGVAALVTDHGRASTTTLETSLLIYI